MQLPHGRSPKYGFRDSLSGDGWLSFPPSPQATCSCRHVTDEESQLMLCCHFVSTLPQHRNTKFPSRWCFWKRCFGRQGGKRKSVTSMRSLYFSWVALWTAKIAITPNNERFPTAPNIGVTGRRIRNRCSSNLDTFKVKNPKRLGQCYLFAHCLGRLFRLCFIQSPCLLTFQEQYRAVGAANVLLL